MVEKQKKYSKSENIKKMTKKHKLFSLKIHKDTGIFKQLKTCLNKGTKHKKNYMEGLKSKNQNIKGGGTP